MNQSNVKKNLQTQYVDILDQLFDMDNVDSDVKMKLVGINQHFIDLHFQIIKKINTEKLDFKPWTILNTLMKNNNKQNCSICGQQLYSLQSINDLKIDDLNQQFYPVIRAKCNHLQHFQCIEQQIKAKPKYECQQCKEIQKVKKQFELNKSDFNDLSTKKQEEVKQIIEEQIEIPKENKQFVEFNQELKDDLLKHQVNDIQTLRVKQSSICQFANIIHISLVDFVIGVQQQKNPLKTEMDLNDLCTICQFNIFDFEDETLLNINNLQQKHLNKQFDLVVRLECTHLFHLECLENCVHDKHIQCPVCTRIYGVKQGDQPDGTMDSHVRNEVHCKDYEKYGTIVINYSMKSGQRNGVQFGGTSRTAFLPNTEEGNKVHQLLKKAFERKLIFTVGRSVTTGQDNQTVWAGIHHKTNLHGGSSHFGYPDPTYFQRVRQELASKGVFE